MLLDVCKVTERPVTNISRMIKCLKKNKLSVWVTSFLTAKSWAYMNTSFSLPYPSFNPSSLLSVLKIKSPLGRKLENPFIPCLRKWQSTPIFLLGKFRGLRRLVGYSPRGRKELDTTERLHLHLFNLISIKPISIYWFLFFFPGHVMLYARS